MTRPWRPADSPFRLALLAILVGLVAGYGAVAFRALIGLVHNLFFFGELSVVYDANLHTTPSPAGPWIILAPVAGAVIVAFLVKNFAPEAKGHGVPEVVEAIYYRSGKIRPIVALVKSLASSISIGSGGAIGREGPIIQIGAAFGSTLSQVIRMPEWQRITLIACGAAGGIAATFNTPIGGLLFAAELLLPEISARTLVPVAIATGTGTFIGQIHFGIHPAFDIPALSLPAAHMTTLSDVAVYVVLGVILGGVSALYIKSIYAFEHAFDRLPGNYYTRHILGMFLVGVMMYLFMRYSGHYYVQGVGYSTVQDVLSSTLANPYLLLMLVFAKLLATSLTLGSGASGGVFSPSLFIGATLGGAYALLAAHFVPHLTIGAPGAAVIGMAGMVGGATGAVITAIVMVFEMTRDYNVIVPLMLTVSIAYGIRRLVMDDSIYSMKLTPRGHYVPESLHTYGYLMRSVAEALSVPTLRIRPGQEIGELLRTLRGRRRTPPHAHLLVADGTTIHGMLSSEHLEQLDQLGHTQVDPSHCTDRDYIVVSEAETMCDVVGRMRDADCLHALVTREGSLDDPDNIIGILAWDDLVRNANLPGRLLRKSSRNGRRQAREDAA